MYRAMNANRSGMGIYRGSVGTVYSIYDASRLTPANTLSTLTSAIDDMNDMVPATTSSGGERARAKSSSNNTMIIGGVVAVVVVGGVLVMASKKKK